jgi:uncharacterized membrane protein YhaH (DUF805 family)
MNWYIQVMNQYAVFNGRSRRCEYWYFVLINIIISFAIFIVNALVGLYGILGIIYTLGVFIPSLAVAVRRLHDTGRSGWYILLVLIPLIGTIILIAFMAEDSERGENEYGPSPKWKRY